MAKSKYLRAFYIATQSGGGVSFSSPFVEYDEHYVKLPTGRRKHYVSETPRGITVLVARGDDTVVEKGKETFTLSESEFVVQKNDINVAALKSMCLGGMIEMADEELHYEYLGKDVPDVIEETIGSGRMIEVNDVQTSKSILKKEQEEAKIANLRAAQNEKAAEKQAIVDVLSAITIKTKKDEVIEGLIDKGIETIEDLAETNKDILLTIKFVGAKVAESMLKEAKELTALPQ